MYRFSSRATKGDNRAYPVREFGGKSALGSDIPSGNSGGGYIWCIIWRFDDRGFFKRARRLFEANLIYQAIQAAGVLMR